MGTKRTIKAMTGKPKKPRKGDNAKKHRKGDNAKKKEKWYLVDTRNVKWVWVQIEVIDKKANVIVWKKD